MRHIQLKNNGSHFILGFGLLIILFSCEVEEIKPVKNEKYAENVEGKEYYISGDVKKYTFDVTKTSFQMSDNVGMQEKFHISTNRTYNGQIPTYYYFEPVVCSGIYTGTAYFENFGVSYQSVLNSYFFRYIITGGFETQLTIKWSEDVYDFNTRTFLDNNRFEYNFKTKKVTSKVKPDVNFYDSINVKDFVYQDVIEIDYSDVKDKIDENTPVKSYFSGKSGLIKIMLKEGIVLERIQ